MTDQRVPIYNPTSGRLEIPDSTGDNYLFDRPATFNEAVTLGSTINGYTLSDWAAKLDYITVTGAVDLDGFKVKLDHITVSQAVDLDQMELDIAALTAAVVLKGTWDASTLLFPTSTKAGESWICTVAGTVGGVPFAVNDRVVALVDGASTSSYGDWHKLDYTDEVQSVAGKTGAVTLVEADITDLQDYLLAEDLDSLAKLNALCSESIIIEGDSRLTLASTALQKDGSTALTSNWNAVASITGYTWESTATSGTPPLVVASNTLVSNLNAALLEGNAASAFALATHTHPAVINTSVVAYAGGGQANAVELTAGSNLVTTVVTDDDSVKLPDIALGKDVHVVNMGVSFLDLFPNASSAIEFSAPNAAMSISPQGTVNLRRVDNINWVRV